MLNRSDERGHSCLFPNLRGKASNFSPLLMLPVGFFVDIQVEEISLYSKFAESFYYEWVLNFVKSLAPIVMIFLL